MKKLALFALFALSVVLLLTAVDATHCRKCFSFPPGNWCQINPYCANSLSSTYPCVADGSTPCTISIGDLDRHPTWELVVYKPGQEPKAGFDSSGQPTDVIYYAFYRGGNAASDECCNLPYATPAEDKFGIWTPPDVYDPSYIGSNPWKALACETVKVALYRKLDNNIECVNVLSDANARQCYAKRAEATITFTKSGVTCETAKKANGETCAAAGDCTSGYCDSATKKCATRPPPPPSVPKPVLTCPSSCRIDQNCGCTATNCNSPSDKIEFALSTSSSSTSTTSSSSATSTSTASPKTFIWKPTHAGTYNVNVTCTGGTSENKPVQVETKWLDCCDKDATCKTKTPGTWYDYDSDGTFDDSTSTYPAYGVTEPIGEIRTADPDKISIDTWCTNCVPTDTATLKYDSSDLACKCKGRDWSTDKQQCCDPGETWEDCGGKCADGRYTLNVDPDTNQAACACDGGTWTSTLTGQHVCCGDDDKEGKDEETWIDTDSSTTPPRSLLCSANNIEVCDISKKDKITTGGKFYCDGTNWQPLVSVRFTTITPETTYDDFATSCFSDGAVYTVDKSTQTVTPCTNNFLSFTVYKELKCGKGGQPCRVEVERGGTKTTYDVPAIFQIINQDGKASNGIICSYGTAPNTQPFTIGFGPTSFGSTATETLKVTIKDLETGEFYTNAPSARTFYLSGTGTSAMSCTNQVCKCAVNSYCRSDSDCASGLCNSKTSFCGEKGVYCRQASECNTGDICNTATNTCETQCAGAISKVSQRCSAACGSIAECNDQALGAKVQKLLSNGLAVPAYCGSTCTLTDLPLTLNLDSPTQSLESTACTTDCNFAAPGLEDSYITFTATSTPADYKFYVDGNLIDSWSSEIPTAIHTTVLTRELEGVRRAALVVDNGTASTARLFLINFARTAVPIVTFPNAPSACVYRGASTRTACESQALTINVKLKDVDTSSNVDATALCTVTSGTTKLGVVNGGTNQNLQLAYTFGSTTPTGAGTVSCTISGAPTHYSFTSTYSRPFTVIGSIKSAAAIVPSSIIPGSSIPLPVVNILDDSNKVVPAPTLCWQSGCADGSVNYLGCNRQTYEVPRDIDSCTDRLILTASAAGYDYYKNTYTTTLSQQELLGVSLFPSEGVLPLAGGTATYVLSISNTGFQNLQVSLSVNGAELENNGVYTKTPFSVTVAPGATRNINARYIAVAVTSDTEKQFTITASDSKTTKNVIGKVLLTNQPRPSVSVDSLGLQNVKVDLNKKKSVRFNVKNTGNVNDTYGFVAKGTGAPFIDVPGSVTLASTASISATANFTAPLQGTYDFQICALSSVSPLVQSCTSGKLTVLVPEFGISLDKSLLSVRKDSTDTVTVTLNPGISSVATVDIDDSACTGWVSNKQWAAKAITFSGSAITNTLSITPAEKRNCDVTVTVSTAEGDKAVAFTVVGLASAEEAGKITQTAETTQQQLTVVEGKMLQLQGIDLSKVEALRTDALNQLTTCRQNLDTQQYELALVACEKSKTSVNNAVELLRYIEQASGITAPAQTAISPIVLLAAVIVVASTAYLLVFRGR